MLPSVASRSAGVITGAFHALPAHLARVISGAHRASRKAQFSVGVFDNSEDCWIKCQHEGRAANQRTSRAKSRRPDVCRNRYLASRPAGVSIHKFKYRLALVADLGCVLRYDNEAGKGDHRHIGRAENSYQFADPETLLADFWNDVEAWRR